MGALQPQVPVQPKDVEMAFRPDVSRVLALSCVEEIMESLDRPQGVVGEGEGDELCRLPGLPQPRCQAWDPRHHQLHGVEAAALEEEAAEEAAVPAEDPLVGRQPAVLAEDHQVEAANLLQVTEGWPNYRPHPSL